MSLDERENYGQSDPYSQEDETRSGNEEYTNTSLDKINDHNEYDSNELDDEDNEDDFTSNDEDDDSELDSDNDYTESDINKSL